MTIYYSVATHKKQVFDVCTGSHLSVLSFIDKHVAMCDITVWDDKKEIVLTLQQQDNQSLTKAMLLSSICPPLERRGA
jgi:hypothetical protein